MTLELFAQHLCNVEGPTIGPDGWMLNVCSVSRPTEPWATLGGDITATHLDRPLDTHVVFSTSTDEVTGIPAALAFGPDGALYICDEGRRSIVRVDASGTIEDFITHHEGRAINGPNDLSFDESGNLYFTDPWTSSPRHPVAAVYGFDWEERELHLIDDGMQFTNGIVASGDRLLVAETFPRMVWAYDIVGPGQATGKRAFCRLPDVDDAPLLPPALREAFGVDYVVGPDGMCLDQECNLYVAHYGGGAVYVYDPDGMQVDVIDVPGVLPTNVCFGGPDLRSLFITIDDPGTIMVSHDRTTKGARLPFCPSADPEHPWAEMLPPGTGAVDLPGNRRLGSDHH